MFRRGHDGQLPEKQRKNNSLVLRKKYPDTLCIILFSLVLLQGRTVLSCHPNLDAASMGKSQSKGIHEETTQCFGKQGSRFL